MKKNYNANNLIFEHKKKKLFSILPNIFYLKNKTKTDTRNLDTCTLTDLGNKNY